jgi:cobalt/nickel transport system permease protein
LITSIPSYLDATAEKASILAMTLGYLPLMLIEGVFTVLIVNFLQKVKPELLENE